MCFYHFHLFFWWSIKFLLQNINQSETGIGGPKLYIQIGRGVTYLVGVPPIMLLYPFVLWSHAHDITWQTKTIISYGHQTWQDGGLPSEAPIHVTVFSSLGPAKSRIKLKAYLHYHSAYGHQLGRMVTNLQGLLL